MHTHTHARARESKHIVRGFHVDSFECFIYCQQLFLSHFIQLDVMAVVRCRYWRKLDLLPEIVPFPFHPFGPYGCGPVSMLVDA